MFGERQQRPCIPRAFSPSPETLLRDETTVSIDPVSLPVCWHTPRARAERPRGGFYDQMLNLIGNVPSNTNVGSFSMLQKRVPG